MSGYETVFKSRLLLVALALLAGLASFIAFGGTAYGEGELPEGFDQTPFVGGLTSPTAMEFAPDGRLFVAEKGGTLRVINQDGQLQEEPFVDISGKTATAGERGLLGVAFDPDFAANGYVYVYYTQSAPGKRQPYNKVVRFTADPANADRALAGSETLLFRLPGLTNRNHNGGAIHFGNADDVNERDKLYVAVGENGRENAAQSLNSLLGKMLRINRDGTIPEDNPFYIKTSGKNKAIWARGLRNPFTFDVQPGTGRIFINDVGQQTWEEINDGKAGANYGWPRYEGPNGGAGFEQPLFAYRHGSSETEGCAITGGAFYNPEEAATAPFPSEYFGDYFYSDICSGWIRQFDPVTKEETGFKSKSGEAPVDVKDGPEGDLFFLSRAGGTVEKISYTTPAP